MEPEAYLSVCCAREPLKVASFLCLVEFDRQGTGDKSKQWGIETDQFAKTTNSLCCFVKHKQRHDLMLLLSLIPFI